MPKHSSSRLRKTPMFWLAPINMLPALILLLLTSVTTQAQSEAPAQASDTAADVCADEQMVLREVEQYAIKLEAVVDGIQTTLNGSAQENIHPGDMLASLDNANGLPDTAGSQWPETLLCGDLRPEYRSVRVRLAEVQHDLVELRQTFWLTLPPVAREELRRIVASHQWLKTQVDPKTSPPEVLAARAKLRKLRWTYATMLPSLKGATSSAQANLWLTHWQEALDLADALDSVPQTLLADLQGAERIELESTYDHLRLHASAVALAFNRIRANLWSNHADAIGRAAKEHHTIKQLLLDEIRAGRSALRWLYLDTRLGNVNANGEHRPILWQLVVGLEYLLGLGSLLVLAVVAKETRTFAEGWQSSFADSSRGIRSRSQLVRLTEGIPQWIPWLTGWYGLALLGSYFEQAALIFLLPVLVFAQLYVVYGLLALAGEWFLKRLAELAGVYLNEEQSREVRSNARQAAVVVLLPWLAQALVRLTIHESLSLSILKGITDLALLLAFGALLRPWRDEFVSAVKYFLPTRLNRFCDKLFQGIRFFIFAPLSAPILVLATVASFINKSLIQFDWYRRLVARSFLLSSALPEDREELPNDLAAFDQYAQWFQQDTGLDVPCLPAQIDDKLHDRLQRWLNQHTDENTLLLTGEKGSGKSTALNRLSTWLSEQEEPIEQVHVSIPPRMTTANELHALLESVLGVSLAKGPAELVVSDEARTPTVVVLDNAQNLFLRTVGGLAAWEALLSLTRARVRNIFWLVSIDNQGWGYLANVFGRYGQFTTVLRCRPWSQSEIRSLILSRNQQSNFRIAYDEVLLSTRGPEAGSLRNAEQLYFSLLWDTCRGNPGIALRLWLSSIHVFSDTVTVGLPEDVSTAFLERTDDEQFFVFAALVIHHNLRSEELLRCTAVSDSTVRSAIRTGLDKGMIIRGDDQRYRIAPLWYFPLTRILARKNLLHE